MSKKQKSYKICQDLRDMLHRRIGRLTRNHYISCKGRTTVHIKFEHHIIAIKYDTANKVLYTTGSNVLYKRHTEWTSAANAADKLMKRIREVMQVKRE